MSDLKTSEIEKNVAAYYSQKLLEYGTEPRGVDWSSPQAQTRRFAQICKVITTGEDFSLLDFGCGYGALHDFLTPQFQNFKYFGFDISEDMIRSARKHVPGVSDSHFSTDLSQLPKTDFVTASGIFNVKGDMSDARWLDYIHETLALIGSKAEKGFSFNCLSNRSDKPFWKDHLYYADPADITSFCMNHFSRHCSLLHDYGMFEFTVVVRMVPTI